jgi:1-pyrroline-4-hydroxy-2-carboxylate deaminase
MSIQWKGVFPALTTKFTKEDKLDLPLFEKNLKAQLDAGVDGVILGGSLGEASVLTNDEKFELVRFTVDKVSGKVPVIMNIAEGSTNEALKLAAEV